MRRLASAVATGVLLAATAAAQQPPPQPPRLPQAQPSAATETVIDMHAVRPGSGFEPLWFAYRRAEAGGDAESAARALDEIRRLRTERNIRSLEEVALAFVARGVDQLRRGNLDGAEQEFRHAIAVDPHLPEGHLGLARRDLKKGLLGFPSAFRHSLAGLTARLDTALGRHDFLVLAVSTGLVTLFAVLVAFAVAQLLRYGSLLRHDLEEQFGPGRGRAVALVVYGILLLLPLATFQGYGWLPFWWLALLYVYATGVEKTVTAVAVALTLIVGPLAHVLEGRALTVQNPLFRAAVQATEAGPDARAIAELEPAVRRHGDDRDLQYLLALQYKKAGDYDQAVALYRELLRTREQDAIALNNLANLEFARGEFPAAIARYRQAAESGVGGDAVAATAYYNLSLASLQRFDRQPAEAARSQADRLAGGLTREYERLWKYDVKNENAVVDLGLTPEQVWAKFEGVREGVARKNVVEGGGADGGGGALAAGFANRFLGLVAAVVGVSFLIGRWRGRRAFTMRCLKCGTPFCKRCHLGAAPGGLCTQCLHLFIVRDGVSGLARSQKLREVQVEEERRDRLFRLLSLLSPGAGHLYARRTLAGLAFSLLWYGLLVAALLSGRTAPLTQAPWILGGPWALVPAVLLLLITYVAANRGRPEFESSLPVLRGPRRGRAA